MLGIIILAIIQGIAEFLPISSSAHLIIFRDLFGVGSIVTGNLEMTFDIALHVGTLLAIGVFFFKDFINMIVKGVTKPKTKEGSLLWKIVVATIPAAIAGVLLEDIVDGVIRSNMFIIAFALIIMGVIIYLTDKYSANKKDVKDISYKDALLIGCAQVFALIPGFSRSGTTIAAARKLKIDRESAAKFSFYLSAPVVFGAALISFTKDGIIDLIIANSSIFIIGILVAFISGLLCISFLLKYIKNNDFKVFMWYRVALGIIVILTLLFR